MHSKRAPEAGSLALAGGLLALLGQKHGLDVGQNSALGDGHAGEQLVQLLVVSDGQLQVTGNDSRLLVVASGVAGQFQNFGGQVFQDGGQVDGGAGAHALGVIAFPKKTVDATDGELKAGA